MNFIELSVVCGLGLRSKGHMLVPLVWCAFVLASFLSEFERFG